MKNGRGIVAFAGGAPKLSDREMKSRGVPEFGNGRPAETLAAELTA